MFCFFECEKLSFDPNGVNMLAKKNQFVINQNQINPDNHTPCSIVTMFGECIHQQKHRI